LFSKLQASGLLHRETEILEDKKEINACPSSAGNNFWGHAMIGQEGTTISGRTRIQ